MKKRSLITEARLMASRVKCDEALADLNVDASPLFSKKVAEANKDLSGAKLPEVIVKKSVRTVS